ncbi:MAG: GHKL domain-containing protein [candidate division Zixibacteria bacterium]|nr:GHKL domain-containing protein [candidate division Zixibacteria bacterium]
MNTKTERKSEREESPTFCRYSSDKPTLALDALAKLTKQFADKPDFKSLMEVFILTLSGQFSVPSAFIVLRNPERGYEPKIFIGTGKYRKNENLLTLKESREFCRFFNENRRPFRIEELMERESNAIFACLLSEAGVRLIAPLSHEKELIGVIALGEKVNRTPYDDTELELFGTMLLTIAPMIANSFLFMEMTHMNIWYLEILDNVKMGVFVFDSEHLLKKVNITGLEILDTFVPELIESNSLTKMPIQMVFPDSVFHSWVRRFIAADVNNHNELIENMVARKDGRECIYNVRVSKIIYDSNYKFDLVVTLDDITTQKENERRLFELEKFADKGQMASSISHELNNYLALILGGVELTQLALGRNDLDKAGGTLEKLKSNIDKMKRFTSGLMDYSRLNTVKKMADLNELVKDVLSFVVVQKKFKAVELHTELAAGLPPFVMDKDQIAQLLLNFLNNAVDAIEEAGIKTGQIWVKTGYKNKLASISVADNGIGIKPEVKNRLFKAHLTTKEKGHGYGLVTCAKIIENHGGQIEIVSEIGAGSMFTLYFPVNTEEVVIEK